MNTSPLFDTPAGESWRSRNANLFPTDASLRWFFRRHKQRLVEESAVVLLRDQWYAVEPQLTLTVLAIGQRAAQSAVEGDA